MLKSLDIKKQLQESWIQEKRNQGLFPKSGNWYYPERWVTREDFINEYGKKIGNKKEAEYVVSNWEEGETVLGHARQEREALADPEGSTANIKVADEEYAQRMSVNQRFLAQEIENEDSPYRKTMLEKQENDFNDYIDKLNELDPESQEIITNAHLSYYTASNIFDVGFTTEDLEKINEVIGVNVESFPTNSEERDKAEFNADLVRFTYATSLTSDFERLDDSEIETESVGGSEYFDDLRYYKRTINEVLNDLDNFEDSYNEVHGGIEPEVAIDLFANLRGTGYDNLNYIDETLNTYSDLYEFLKHSKSTDESISSRQSFDGFLDAYANHGKIRHDTYTKNQSLIYHRSGSTNHDTPLYNLKALMEYQGGPHDVINMFLYNYGDIASVYDDTEQDSKLLNTVKAIDSAFLTGGKKNKRLEIFYRGISNNQYRDILNAYESNEKIYQNKSYISTSTDFSSAKSFGRVIEFHIPPETIPFINMNDTLWDSNFTGEEEFLLPRDTEFDLEFDENRQRIILKAKGYKENSTAGKRTFYNLASEDTLDHISMNMDENDIADLEAHIEDAEKNAFGEISEYGNDNLMALQLIPHVYDWDEDRLVSEVKNAIKDDKLKNELIKYFQINNTNQGVLKKSSFAIDIMTINLSGVDFEVLMPDNPHIGLGNREHMDFNTGMIFYSPPKNIRRGSTTFTMHNMQFPLDFVCIDDNNQIIHIERNVQPYPHNLVELPLESEVVFEVNAGAADHCKVGDIVDGLSSAHSILKGLFNKMMPIQKQLAPEWVQQKHSEGLYPKSGNWYYPYRWISREDFIKESDNPEQAEQMIDRMDSYISGKGEDLGQTNNTHFNNLVKDFNSRIYNIEDLQSIDYDTLSNSIIPYATKKLWENTSDSTMSDNLGLLHIMQVFHEDSPYQYGMAWNEDEMMQKYYFMHQPDAYKELNDKKEYLKDIDSYTNSILGAVIDDFEDVGNDDMANSYKNFAANVLKTVNDNSKKLNNVMNQLEMSTGKKDTDNKIKRNKEKYEKDIRDTYDDYYTPTTYYSMVSIEAPVEIPPLILNALSAYQNSSTDINAAIFNDQTFAYDEPDSKLSQDIQALDTAISMMPINKKPMTLWRGVLGKSVWNHMVDMYNEGEDTYTNLPFMSTSSNFDTAKGFVGGNGGLIRINVPANSTKMLPVDQSIPGGTGFGEKEFLLPRESKFYMEWNEENDYMELTLIPDQGFKSEKPNIGINNVYESLNEYNQEDMYNLIWKTKKLQDSTQESWPELSEELGESVQALEAIEHLKFYKQISSKGVTSEVGKERLEYFKDKIHDMLGNMKSQNIIDTVHKELEYIRGGSIKKEIRAGGSNMTPPPEKHGGKKSESDKFRELGEKNVLNWFLIQGITQEEWLAYQEKRVEEEKRRKDKKRKYLESLYEEKIINKQLDPAWVAYKRGQGLVPKSGDWYYPQHWISPEEFVEEWTDAGYGDWANEFIESSNVDDNDAIPYAKKQLDDTDLPTLYDALNKFNEINLKIESLHKEGKFEEIMEFVDKNSALLKEYGVKQVSDIEQMVMDIRETSFNKIKDEHPVLDKYSAYDLINKDLNDKNFVEVLFENNDINNYSNALKDTLQFFDEIPFSKNIIENNINKLNYLDFFSQLGSISMEDFDKDLVYDNILDFNQYVKDYKHSLGQIHKILPQKNMNIAVKHRENIERLLKDYTNDAESFILGGYRGSELENYDVNEIINNYTDDKYWFKFADRIGKLLDIDTEIIQSLMIYQQGSLNINIVACKAPDIIYNSEHDDKDLIKNIRLLDSFIEENGERNTDDVKTLYRGVQASVFETIFESLNEGEYNNPAFMSTSEDLGVAAGIGKVIEIKIPPNTIPHIAMNNFFPESSYAHQKEFILPRNTKFSLEFDKMRQRLILTAKK